jgi:hypothetical protein
MVKVVNLRNDKQVAFDLLYLMCFRYSTARPYYMHVHYTNTLENRPLEVSTEESRLLSSLRI